MNSLSPLRAQLDAYIAEEQFLDGPQTLYEPLRYILDIGGKRIRPLLTLMGCALYQDEVDAALPAAYAVELFHNFSLMHDDIMDAAPLRRGKAAVHKAYNVNTAILSGDVMFAQAYAYLLKTPEATGLELLQIFNTTSIEVCEGQQMDMDFEQQTEVHEAEYLKMIELKTAVLLAAALYMGARIGGATQADAQHLYEFGRCIGVAFQLQDDLLDSFGDPETFGKQVGGDIIQNKKTFLVIHALKQANPSQHKALTHWLNQRIPTADAAEKVAAVKTLFSTLNVPQITQQKMQTYYDKAMQALDAVQVPETRKAALRNLADKLMHRVA